MLKLELADVEIVTDFGVEIEHTVVSNASGVSVIERPPKGSDLPGDDVDLIGAQVVAHQI